MHVPAVSRLSRAAAIDHGDILIWVFAWAIALFILVLLGIIVWMSLIPGFPGDPGWTLKNYADVAGGRAMLQALTNSAIVGAGTVAVNLLFAAPMAWLVQRTDIPGKTTIITLVAVSVLIPSFLKAMGWIMLLSPQIGMINSAFIALFPGAGPLANIYGLGGVVFIQGLTLMPAMFFLLSGSMRAMDPSLEEAATMCGARGATIAWRVGLPLIWPALLAATIYNFVTAVSLYEVAALLLGDRTPVIATEMYLHVRSSGGVINLAYGAVYGVLMMVLAGGTLWAYVRATRRSERFAVVTGKGYRPTLIVLGRWKWPALAFVGLFVLLAEVMPFATLFWMSLLPSLALPSPRAFELVSFANYARIWGLIGGWSTIWNTVLLLVWVPVLCVGFSLAVSMVTMRSRLPGRGALDVIVMLPHVVPGIAFGFAMMIFGIFLNLWIGLSLYGTLAAIVLAVVVERLPYATRVTNAALLQLHRDIDEAASVCGAGRFQTSARIVVPLIAPSLGYAFIWVALLALREVTIPLLLAGPENTLIAVRIWTLWGTGQYGVAAATGVAVFLAGALLLFMAQRLARGARMLVQ